MPNLEELGDKVGPSYMGRTIVTVVTQPQPHKLHQGLGLSDICGNDQNVFIIA